MAITAQDVNKLRKHTGAGMMDCKKALVEADGDFDEAIVILRKKGQKVSASRADRTTTEGMVFVETNADRTEATLIALNCETDFVAMNEDFQGLGKLILKTALENKPASIEDLLNLKVDGLSLADTITENIGKIGEKLEVSAYETVKADQVVPYIHTGSKLGVLVALAGVNGEDESEAGKNVGMQIAAMNPVAVDKDGIDQSIIDKEIQLGKEMALAEGKPEAIIEKIAMGKLNKFFKDNTLLNQAYVKDPSLTVAKYLDSVKRGMTVSSFKRIAIGG